MEIIIKAIFTVSIICLVSYLLYKRNQYWDRLEKKYELEIETTNKRIQEDIKKKELEKLIDNVELFFEVKFEEIHELTTQDEIVRKVNLDAIQLSMACVNQDKEKRNGKSTSKMVDCDILVTKLKRQWYRDRSLALKVLPELTERLPHFSEFEPLKSYNAEHLLKKAEKKLTVDTQSS